MSLRKVIIAAVSLTVALLSARWFAAVLGADWPWVLPLVLAAVVAICAWRLVPESTDPAADAREALDEARRYLDYNLIRTGEPQEEGGKRLVESARREFGRLEEGLRNRTLEPSFVVESAERLARVRVYLLPKEQLEHLAGSMLNNLHQFGVPQDVITREKQLVDAVEKSDLPTKRSAVEELLAEHDYWAVRADRWGQEANRIAMVGLVIETLTLAAAVVCFLNGFPIPGFIMAGASGAGCSVLLHVPRLSVCGRTVDFWGRAIARYCAGILATFVGLGVAMMGLVNPAFATGNTFTEAVNSSSTSCSVQYLFVFMCVGIVLGFTESLLVALTDAIAGRLIPAHSDRPTRSLDAPTPGA